MFGSLASQPLSTPLRPMEPVSNNQLAKPNPVSSNPTSHGVKKPEMGPPQSKVGLQATMLPTKRKAATELLVSNKRVVQMETNVSSPRWPQQSGLSNKKMIRNESMSSRIVSPRVQTSKSKTAPLEVSPKVQNKSFEAVRVKMRETLAAALCVGNQDKEVVPNEAGSTAGEADAAPGSTPGDTAEKPQYNYVMPDTDGSFGDSFFVKDELLQGNGLSWAWDMEVAELKEAQTNGKPILGSNNVNGNRIGQVSSSPQELAVKIEAELFKLFGGVNKKYRERGRSLMFNLKDPSNPELREKVLSSKISPESLCSMTPEELASKELSEWRMAKAEELDKMIVLPDSDVDMRRLVKKTHKGEYQVEVDQDIDDGVSVEVSVGSSSHNRFREKTKTVNLSSSGDGVKVKDKMVAQGEKNSLTVSTDGTDFMQELIEDEFKDEGFLPPIVSLDEFMESLDSEPPFDNLPVDGKVIKGQSDKDNSKTGGEGTDDKAISGTASANGVAAAEASTNNKPDVKIMQVLSSVKTSETSAEISSGSPDGCLWEGELQLTLSSTVPVIGVFKSGEKTSTKEWPGSMEIKGRVRLAAFEKFLQELPMSRSRAVMVVHFVLKDASSEYHQASLSEAVNSYVAEERVGFAEPSPGVEVYFCPPHKRTTETLSRLLSKDQNPEGELIGGLIGVVVWRRPISSSHHNHNKHHRKHLTSRRQENKNSNININSNIISKSLHAHAPPQSNNGDVDDDDDDVPPGFGPGVVARDEDDLPEFSFSKGSNSSGQTLPAPSGPVAHMRQLVYEYGQNGNNTTPSWNGNRHWNQDDDDIPEWKPQLQNHHQTQVFNHSVQGVHLVNQVRPQMGHIVTQVMPIQQPVNLMQNNWLPPPPAPHGLMLPNAGQPYGGQWRQDDPSGRGF